MIKGVIFDMDGVLVDNRDAHIEAFEIICRKYGVPFDREKFMPTFGMTNDLILERLMPEVIKTTDWKKIAVEKENIYREIFERTIAPAKGLVDFLKALKKEGYKTAVGSSGNTPNVNFVLDRCGIAGYFDAIANGDMITRGKPDPEVYLLAAKKLELAPGECIVVEDAPVGIRAVTFGRVQDLGIRDINNMGAAMAPAAAATLLRYLTDTNTQPQEFDAICTGDLGHVGSQLFRELLAAEGLLLKNHVDCGSLLYDAEGQSVHSGASGPGCCAAVLCGHLLPRLERRGQRRVLFLATGALMSQTTFLQKESIPAISHLVELAAPEEQNGGNT